MFERMYEYLKGLLSPPLLIAPNKDKEDFCHMITQLLQKSDEHVHLELTIMRAACKSITKVKFIMNMTYSDSQK